MPINFTVVPVEDAEGGGSGAAAAGGAKPDNLVPRVVVVEEDGDPSPPAQDSGTSPTGRTPAATLLLFGITTENTLDLPLAHQRRRAQADTETTITPGSNLSSSGVCVCARAGCM